MKRTNLKKLEGKTIKRIERDKSGFRIIFTDSTSCYISEDSLFDTNGNYFDTSKIN